MALVKCKHCGEKSDKSEMLCVIKGNSKHYVHEYCDRLKQAEKDEKEKEKLIKKQNSQKDKECRAKATSIFYEYTSSLVPVVQLNVAFKKCLEKGLTCEDILYTMEYIVKNDCVLKYPMGILYYIDRAMRDKREVDKIKTQSERVITAPIKIIPLHMKAEKEVNSDYDISDLL